MKPWHSFYRIAQSIATRSHHCTLTLSLLAISKTKTLGMTKTRSHTVAIFSACNTPVESWTKTHAMHLQAIIQMCDVSMYAQHSAAETDFLARAMQLVLHANAPS